MCKVRAGEMATGGGGAGGTTASRRTVSSELHSESGGGARETAATRACFREGASVVESRVIVLACKPQARTP